MDISTKILSDITVYMKYARYIPEKKRRETWKELVERNISWLFSLTYDFSAVLYDFRKYDFKDSNAEFWQIVFQKPETLT